MDIKSWFCHIKKEEVYMAKRANGEGTIRKRKDGRWEGRYYDPIADKQKSIYGKTQKEVREKLSEIAFSKDILTFVTTNTITVDEWFEIFINTYKKGLIRPQSVSVFKSYYKCHIKPYIGDKQIKNVTQQEITKILKEESVKCNAGTIKQIKTYTNEIFRQAVKSKIIKLNPVTDVQIPQNQNTNHLKQEITKNELYWFFRGLNEYKHNDTLFFLLLLMTGMRRGEAIALKWRNISSDFRFVYIDTTYVEYIENHHIIKDENPPKTKTSIRTIPLQEQIADALKNQKEKAHFIAEQFNREFSEDDYVFIEPKANKPLALDHFKYTITAIRNYLKKEYNIDLNKFSSHYFRHTFASIAIRQNIPLETIRELLGHSDYNTILKYAHANNDDKINAINKMFS